MSDHSTTLNRGHATANAAHHDDHDAKGPLQYLLTLLALLTLTAITVGVSYIDFGSGNIVVAVIVATAKAILVGLIFMHLLHDKKINAVIFVSAFLFLSLLFLFTLLDVGSREVVTYSKPPAGGVPQDSMKVATAVDGKPVPAQPKPTPAVSSAPAFATGTPEAPSVTPGAVEKK